MGTRDTEGTETEAEIWHRGLNGDGRAFGQVFDLHRARVFRVSYRLLRDADDAEDATAVTFLELWRRRQAVQMVDGSVLPWLLVTAGNAARNLNRARRRYRTLIADLPHGDHHPSAEDESFVDRFDDERLAEALRRLPPKDMNLVTLVMIEGWSPTEAASLCGVSPGAARTRLHRIRTALRTELARPAIDHDLAELGLS